ncbi:MAG: hypothetical protein P1U64_05715 [Alcanivoracaceae bacterium]|nr:hypothetical protein [Alcanivoracaceae bacterium]
MEPRKPLDDRPTKERYQYTQGDGIVAREHQRELRRQKQKKAKSWVINGLIVVCFFFFVFIVVG